MESCEHVVRKEVTKVNDQHVDLSRWSNPVNPIASPLSRLLDDHFDIFNNTYEEWFEGALTPISIAPTRYRGYKEPEPQDSSIVDK